LRILLKSFLKNKRDNVFVTLTVMKIKSYLFLFALIIILFFIIGVRYGQKVEQANKTINYYLSLPPTKPPEPTISKDFLSYTHTSCGVSFVYPAWLSKEKETTVSAQFLNQGKMALFISCDKITPTTVVSDPNMVTFQKKNFNNNKTISFSVTKSLFPIIEKSLELISTIK